MPRDRSPTLTSSTSPASTPSGTCSTAPSSASMVFSATSGSRSGRASPPNSANRANSTAAGRCGQFLLEHRHPQTRSEAPRYAANASPSNTRDTVLKRSIRHRPQAGVFPRLLAPSCRCTRQSRAPERLGRRIPDAHIPRQPVAHRLIARQKSRHAGLDRSRHDVHSSSPLPLREGARGRGRRNAGTAPSPQPPPASAGEHL